MSQVEKFELSDDAYAKRTGSRITPLSHPIASYIYHADIFTDSVLAYKQQLKIGRFAPPSDNPTSNDTADVGLLEIAIGARCEVESAEEGLHKRGTVRFVGQTAFSNSGIWIGIEYDEPIGRNDGSCVNLFLLISDDDDDVASCRVQGKRYFTCRPNYGVFVRSDRVTVGDFPVEELNFDDDEEM